MAKERIGLILNCEGMGDSLYAIPVIRAIHASLGNQATFDIFTYHTGVFQACPYVENVYSIRDEAPLQRYINTHRTMPLFDPQRLPHYAMDTMDFMNVPLGAGQLSFREKQLEYFPVEADQAERFDVVLNTSQTWPTRSWPVANWQRLANALVQHGLSVAVVGKNVRSEADSMEKRSLPLEGCRNLVNQLSLDQTYFTIAKSGLFVTCQNGLSVLAGATDAEIIVLDMSIDWSKRAIYRNENPFYKVEYVKGNCRLYCCQSDVCPNPANQGRLECVPTYDQVARAVFRKLGIEG